MEATDHALMLAYRDGGYEAFEILYRRHRDALMRYFKRQTHSAVAEELFQDVWAKVIAARNNYRPDASFKTWLYAIARNRLYDHYRTQGRTPHMNSDEADALVSEHNPEQQADIDQQVQQLLTAVALLPHEQREVFLLREEAGFTLPEIAKLVGCNLEAAKSRLRYAVKKLKQGLEVHCDA